jgi:alcohol dehydrogenase class IV
MAAILGGVEPSEPFTWTDGERVVRYGPGVLADAPGLLAERGFEGFTLLSTPRSRNAAPELAGAATRIVDVPYGPVPEAAAAVADEAKGLLVALGGGRVIDVAKALAAVRRGRCAAVPTTLSGAEMTRGHRLPAGAPELPRVRPAVVVVDPALAASQPLPDLAGSAMNALAHALEALYVRQRGPVTTLAGLRASELLARGLRASEPDREALALGALLAGYALGGTALGVHHVLAQTVVRTCGTPHGQTNAVLLPHSVRLMTARAPAEIAAFANALEPGSAAAAAPFLVGRIAVLAGASSLSELDVTEDRLPEIARLALERAELGNTPDPPGEQEVWTLLREAL